MKRYTINTFSSLILFPTQEALEEMSVSLIDPLTEAMHGPLLDICVAWFVTWRTKVFLVLVAGIFSIVYMIRHTRLAEEQGKRELWGAYLIYINGDFLGAAADFRSPPCFFTFFMDYASKATQSSAGSVVLCMAAFLLTGIGILLFRRRDIAYKF